MGEAAARGAGCRHRYASTAGANWPMRSEARLRFDLPRSKSNEQEQPFARRTLQDPGHLKPAVRDRGDLDHVARRAVGPDHVPGRPGLIGHAGCRRGEIRIGLADRPHDHAGRYVDQRRCPDTSDH